ncbi:MAG TPA: hypothetical protein ENI23_10020 [bacterium]|nr:hypothetical protein [bacterium]
MTDARVCPVCNGSGRYDIVPSGTSTMPSQVCHGCDGKGWVEVGSGEIQSYQLHYGPCDGSKKYELR